MATTLGWRPGSKRSPDTLHRLALRHKENAASASDYRSIAVVVVIQIDRGWMML
jgi:hypothetical protein